jgi:hypothetical protein
MNRYKIHENYRQFLASFSEIEKDKIEKYNDGKSEISKEIFRQMFKIRQYAHEHGINFDRGRSPTMADIFQDIIAYYLKTFLDDRYKVRLEVEEKGEEKTYRPDILIEKKYGEKFKSHFIIEVKTSLQWKTESIKECEEEIKKMSKCFSIKQDNIIYILESGNLNKKFLAEYYEINTKNIDNRKAKENRLKNIPYKYFYPLFYKTGDDIEELKEEGREGAFYENIKGEKLEKLAAKNIITKFEDIIKMINEKE